ncbi:MAG: hypothetical protein IPM57_00800 [Oligoflexia bacterium]|nr:hypothetical protein [Oligoflexia bacterium]
MKNGFFILMLLYGITNATAATPAKLGNYSLLSGAYDFSAPVVSDRSNLAAATAGSIVYDSGSSAFYGLPVSADPTNSANWIPLSGPSGTVNVVSSGATRTEYVYFGGSGSSTASTACDSSSGSTCTIYNQSGAVSSVGRTSDGVYTINFTSGTFSDVPSCTFNLFHPGSYGTCISTNDNSATAVNLDCRTISGSPSYTATAVQAICAGPR